MIDDLGLRTPKEDPLFDDDGFHWEVWPGGHQIFDAIRKDDGQPVKGIAWDLASTWPAEKTKDGSYRYYPFNHPDLYVQFSKTPTTPDGILKFVNQWGTLWGREFAEPSGILFVDPKYTTKARATDPKQRLNFRGQPVGWENVEELWRWRREIEYMHEVIRVWQTCEVNDAPADKRPIPAKIQNIFHGGMPWKFCGPVGQEFTAETKYGEGTTSSLFRSNRVWARHEINYRLEDLVGVRLKWNQREFRHSIVIRPNCLIGALWLQLARAIDAGVTYLPCKVCGKLMHISSAAGLRRRDSKLCSAACRQKDYRRRVNEAKAMKAAGTTVQRIAKHFQSDADTIRYWLSKEK